MDCDGDCLGVTQNKLCELCNKENDEDTFEDCVKCGINMCVDCTNTIDILDPDDFIYDYICKKCKEKEIERRNQIKLQK